MVELIHVYRIGTVDPRGYAGDDLPAGVDAGGGHARPVLDAYPVVGDAGVAHRQAVEARVVADRESHVRIALREHHVVARRVGGRAAGTYVGHGSAVDHTRARGRRGHIDARVGRHAQHLQRLVGRI